MSQLSRFPSDVGPLNSRFRDMLKDRFEQSAPIQKERTVYFPVAQDTFDDITMAETLVRVRHGLPWIPKGWKIITKDKAGQVFQGKPPDRNYLYLYSSVDAFTVKLEIS